MLFDKYCELPNSKEISRKMFFKGTFILPCTFSAVVYWSLLNEESLAEIIRDNPLFLLAISIVSGIVIWLAVAFKINKKVPNFAVARRRSAYFCSTEYYKAFVTILFLYIGLYLVVFIATGAKDMLSIEEKGNITTIVKGEDKKENIKSEKPPLYVLCCLGEIIEKETSVQPDKMDLNEALDWLFANLHIWKMSVNMRLILLLAFLGPLTGVCDIKKKETSI
jgi:hypothetical protein